VPRSQVSRESSRAEWIIGETAGTLGRPKFAVHRRDEFEAAFVAPFVAAANRVAFPRGVNWLFIGPSGPHVIGKAARCCAQALQSPDPFTVDLDPRWAKKLTSGSFAARRYREHVENQALAVLESQAVGVIFSTPVVLESLGPRIPPEKRAAIRGIHLGGLAVSAAARAAFAENFPNAIILSGYGNTLFGMMPELAYSAHTGFDYYPHGMRLVVRVIEAGEGAEDLAERLGRQVAFGQRGQVVVHRLDETQFIANMVERDTAIRMPAPDGAASDGFALPGLRDPQPIINESVKPATGLY
jgi:hypothetical protein